MKTKKRQRVPMRSIFLRAVATAGIVGVAVVAPQLLNELKRFDRAANNRKALYRRIDQAATRLAAAGLVKVSGVRGNRCVEITSAGREYLERIEFEEYQIPEPAFWDGKWRIAMFDITERRKRVRIQLRRLLAEAGFVKVQDSVWAYPYPCDEFITLLRAHLKSGVGELRIFVAEALESDKSLREHFDL